jgi:centromere protein I
VLAFLKEYLPMWHGRDNVDAILELLSYIRIEDFDVVYATYFRAVESVLAAHGVSAYPKLIDFYTSLLHHQIAAACSEPTNRGMLEQQAISGLAKHVSTLSTSALLSLSSTSNTDLTSSILSFFELLSSCSKPHVVSIILPPMHLVYLVAQDTSPTVLSRICGIIGSYKLAFDGHPKPVKSYYSAAVTDAFNFCLRDMYNLVWVARGFTIQDQKSEGLYCDPALRSTLNSYLSSLEHEYAIGNAFNLSNNMWLTSLSAAAWRTVEEREIEREGYDKKSIMYHQGPVSERSLEALKRKGGVSVEWEGAEGYKVLVLQWLDERGLGGIKHLMFATVMNLKGSK